MKTEYLKTADHEKMVEKEVKLESKILKGEAVKEDLKDLSNSPRGIYLRGLYELYISKDFKEASKYFDELKESANEDLLLHAYREIIGYSDEYLDYADTLLEAAAKQGNETAKELLENK